MSLPVTTLSLPKMLKVVTAKPPNGVADLKLFRFVVTTVTTYSHYIVVEIPGFYACPRVGVQ